MVKQQTDPSEEGASTKDAQKKKVFSLLRTTKSAASGGRRLIPFNNRRLAKQQIEVAPQAQPPIRQISFTSGGPHDEKETSSSGGEASRVSSLTDRDGMNRLVATSATTPAVEVERNTQSSISSKSSAFSYSKIGNEKNEKKRITQDMKLFSKQTTMPQFELGNKNSKSDAPSGEPLAINPASRTSIDPKETRDQRNSVVDIRVTNARPSAESFQVETSSSLDPPDEKKEETYTDLERSALSMSNTAVTSTKASKEDETSPGKTKNTKKSKTLQAEDAYGKEVLTLQSPSSVPPPPPPPPPPQPTNTKPPVSESDKKVAFERVRALLNRVNPRGHRDEHSKTPRVNNASMSQRLPIDPSGGETVRTANLGSEIPKSSSYRYSSSLAQKSRINPVSTFSQEMGLQRENTGTKSTTIEEGKAAKGGIRAAADPPSSPVVERKAVDAPPIENGQDMFPDILGGQKSNPGRDENELFPDILGSTDANKGESPVPSYDAVSNSVVPSQSSNQKSPTILASDDDFLVDQSIARSPNENMDPVAFGKASSQNKAAGLSKLEEKQSKDKTSKFIFDDVSSSNEQVEVAEKVPQRSMRLRVLQSSVVPKGSRGRVSQESMDGDGKNAEVGAESSDDEIPAPAINTAAMLAALESSLPPRKASKTGSSLKTTSRSQRSKSQKPLTEPNGTQKSFSQKANAIAEKHKEKKRLSAGKAKAEKRLSGSKALARQVTKPVKLLQTSLRMTNTFPHEINVCKDDPISDLDSVRNMTKKVKVDQSMDDLESISILASNDDDHDRYAPLFTVLTPESPVNEDNAQDDKARNFDSDSNLKDQVGVEKDIPDESQPTFLADEITEWTVESGGEGEEVEMVIHGSTTNMSREVEISSPCSMNDVLKCLALDETGTENLGNQGNRKSLQESGVTVVPDTLASRNQSSGPICEADQVLEILALDSNTIEVSEGGLLFDFPTKMATPQHVGSRLDASNKITTYFCESPSGVGVETTKQRILSNVEQTQEKPSQFKSSPKELDVNFEANFDESLDSTHNENQSSEWRFRSMERLAIYLASSTDRGPATRHLTDLASSTTDTQKISSDSGLGNDIKSVTTPFGGKEAKFSRLASEFPAEINQEPSGVLMDTSEELSIPSVPWDPTGMLPVHSTEDPNTSKASNEHLSSQDSGESNSKSGFSDQESRDMSTVPQKSPDSVELDCIVEPSDNSTTAQTTRSKIEQIMSIGQQVANLSPGSKFELSKRMENLDIEARLILKKSIRMAEIAKTGKQPHLHGENGSDLIDLTSYASSDEVDEAVWLFDIPPSEKVANVGPDLESDTESILDLAGLGDESAEFLPTIRSSALDSVIQYATMILDEQSADKIEVSDMQFLESQDAGLFVPSLSPTQTPKRIDFPDTSSGESDNTSNEETPKILLVVKGQDVTSFVERQDEPDLVVIEDATAITLDHSHSNAVMKTARVWNQYDLYPIIEDREKQKVRKMNSSPPIVNNKTAPYSSVQSAFVRTVYPEKIQQRKISRKDQTGAMKHPLHSVISLEEDKSRASTLTDDQIATHSNEIIQDLASIESNDAQPAYHVRVKPSPELLSDSRNLQQNQSTQGSVSLVTRNPKDAPSNGDIQPSARNDMDSTDKSVLGCHDSDFNSGFEETLFYRNCLNSSHTHSKQSANSSMLSPVSSSGLQQQQQEEEESENNEKVMKTNNKAMPKPESDQRIISESNRQLNDQIVSSSGLQQQEEGKSENNEKLIKTKNKTMPKPESDQRIISDSNRQLNDQIKRQDQRDIVIESPVQGKTTESDFSSSQFPRKGAEEIYTDQRIAKIRDFALGPLVVAISNSESSESFEVVEWISTPEKIDKCKEVRNVTDSEEVTQSSLLADPMAVPFADTQVRHSEVSIDVMKVAGVVRGKVTDEDKSIESEPMLVTGSPVSLQVAGGDFINPISVPSSISEESENNVAGNIKNELLPLKSDSNLRDAAVHQQTNDCAHALQRYDAIFESAGDGGVDEGKVKTSEEQRARTETVFFEDNSSQERTSCLTPSRRYENTENPESIVEVRNSEPLHQDYLDLFFEGAETILCGENRTHAPRIKPIEKESVFERASPGQEERSLEISNGTDCAVNSTSGKDSHHHCRDIIDTVFDGAEALLCLDEDHCKNGICIRSSTKEKDRGHIVDEHAPFADVLGPVDGSRKAVSASSARSSGNTLFAGRFHDREVTGTPAYTDNTRMSRDNIGQRESTLRIDSTAGKTTEFNINSAKISSSSAETESQQFIVVKGIQQAQSVTIVEGVDMTKGYFKTKEASTSQPENSLGSEQTNTKPCNETRKTSEDTRTFQDESLLDSQQTDSKVDDKIMKLNEDIASSTNEEHTNLDIDKRSIFLKNVSVDTPSPESSNQMPASRVFDEPGAENDEPNMRLNVTSDEVDISDGQDRSPSHSATIFSPAESSIVFDFSKSEDFLESERSGGNEVPGEQPKVDDNYSDPQLGQQRNDHSLSPSSQGKVSDKSIQRQSNNTRNGRLTYTNALSVTQNEKITGQDEDRETSDPLFPLDQRDGSTIGRADPPDIAESSTEQTTSSSESTNKGRTFESATYDGTILSKPVIIPDFPSRSEGNLFPNREGLEVSVYTNGSQLGVGVSECLSLNTESDHPDPLTSGYSYRRRSVDAPSLDHSIHSPKRRGLDPPPFDSLPDGLPPLPEDPPSGDDGLGRAWSEGSERQSLQHCPDHGTIFVAPLEATVVSTTDVIGVAINETALAADVIGSVVAATEAVATKRQDPDETREVAKVGTPIDNGIMLDSPASLALVDSSSSKNDTSRQDTDHSTCTDRILNTGREEALEKDSICSLQDYEAQETDEGVEVSIRPAACSNLEEMNQNSSRQTMNGGSNMQIVPRQTQENRDSTFYGVDEVVLPVESNEAVSPADNTRNTENSLRNSTNTETEKKVSRTLSSQSSGILEQAVVPADAVTDTGSSVFFPLVAQMTDTSWCTGSSPKKAFPSNEITQGSSTTGIQCKSNLRDDSDTVSKEWSENSMTKDSEINMKRSIPGSSMKILDSSESELDACDDASQSDKSIEQPRSLGQLRGRNHSRRRRSSRAFQRARLRTANVSDSETSRSAPVATSSTGSSTDNRKTSDPSFENGEKHIINSMPGKTSPSAENAVLVTKRVEERGEGDSETDNLVQLTRSSGNNKIATGSTKLKYQKSEEEARITLKSSISHEMKDTTMRDRSLSISSEPHSNSETRPTLSRVERVRAMAERQGYPKRFAPSNDGMQISVSSEPESLTASPKGKHTNSRFTRSPKLQNVLDRLRNRNSSAKGESSSADSAETEPVDVNDLFSRYDTIVKNMVVNDKAKLDRIQQREASNGLRMSRPISPLIDVTHLGSEAEDRSKSDYIATKGYSISKLRASPNRPNELLNRPIQRTPNTTWRRHTISKSSSFSSASEFSVTPSQKARDLRKQLDHALETSVAIRDSQEKLNIEIATFKSRLQWQSHLSPHSLSPVSRRITLRRSNSTSDVPLGTTLNTRLQETSLVDSDEVYVSLAELRKQHIDDCKTDKASYVEEVESNHYLSEPDPDDSDVDDIRSQQVDSILNGLAQAASPKTMDKAASQRSSRSSKT